MSPPRKTSGLLTAAELKADMQAQQEKQAALLATMAASSNGAAETVHRDKFGQRIDLKLEKLKKKEEERKKEEREVQNLKWGRGLAQFEEYEKRLQEEELMRSQPFARHADDDRMNQKLRDEIRAEDPMAAYMLQQREKAAVAAGIPQKPKYRGPPGPPNRFGIAPGHKWDGRDRSNGFEGRLFKAESEKSAWDEEAYKWRTEDM